MSHCFRLRFDLEGFMRVASDRQEYVLDEDGDQRVALTVTDPEHTDDASASSVVVTGSGYATEDGALEAGHTWTAVLQRAFATL
jgi:hypothetical protein